MKELSNSQNIINSVEQPIVKEKSIEEQYEQYRAGEAHVFVHEMRK
jgi:hypothetical protein